MYFLEIFSIFLLFMFVGLIFSPVLGGCFALLIVLLIFSGVIIFFSLNFIWFLLAGLIFYAISFGIKYYRWYKLPEVNAYLEENPQCRLEQGISCKYCNSTDIHHHGLFNRKSRSRFYVCSSCGHTLYRFNIL